MEQVGLNNKKYQIMFSDFLISSVNNMNLRKEKIMKNVTFDITKATRYTARDGTIFFANANKWKIQTEDDEVSLEFRRHGSMNRHTTIFLNFGEKGIKISGPDDDNIAFKSRYTEGAIPPVQVTQIIYRINRDGDKFKDFDEQKRITDLMVDMLSSFSGNWTASAHGREVNPVTIISDEFKEKLKSGVYIDG